MPTIIEKIRDFVEEECKKPSSKYGYEPFPCHFVPVVIHAKQLADKLGGDEEVIEIAAWLHDIGSIMV
jgi:HD superfamily phosphodiesterase